MSFVFIGGAAMIAILVSQKINEVRTRRSRNIDGIPRIDDYLRDRIGHGAVINKVAQTGQNTEKPGLGDSPAPDKN